MSIRTIREHEVKGVNVAEVEVTDEDGDSRIVYEVSCPVCDTFESGLTLVEAHAEIDAHDH